MERVADDVDQCSGSSREAGGLQVRDLVPLVPEARVESDVPAADARTHGYGELDEKARARLLDDVSAPVAGFSGRSVLVLTANSELPMGR